MRALSRRGASFVRAKGTLSDRRPSSARAAQGSGNIAHKGVEQEQSSDGDAESGRNHRAAFPILRGERAAAGSDPAAGDSREMFAAVLTDSRNDRFARVIVNRLWKQFLGFGIIEPVDDWEASVPSHPELLEWLG